MKRFVRHLPGYLCKVCRNTKILLLLSILAIILFVATRLTLSSYKSGHQSKISEHRHTNSQLVSPNVIASNAVSSSSKSTKTNNIINRESLKKPKPSYDVHIFYYPWYGDPTSNGHYIHWNHRYLPHWSPEVAKIYPKGVHNPPDDISSNFYPALGPYSSNNIDVIRNHMQQLSFAGVGVVAVSYYPPGLSDDNGEDWQSVFPLLLKEANIYKIKVTFHIEPYKGRSEETVKHDIKHIIDTYSNYPGFYKMSYKNKLLPFIYVYDSYHTKPSAWSKLLHPGKDSIRGTKYDCFIIGLVVDDTHQSDMVVAGFDGFYTYFASNGFTFGSSRENWEALNNFAIKNNLLYIPSVGPGYIDTRIRPWNNGNTRKRLNGQYYKESWIKTLSLNPRVISVTSFNEWHEGTQIEEAVPKDIENFKYLNYLPEEPNYYLRITKAFIHSFVELKKIHRTQAG